MSHKKFLKCKPMMSLDKSGQLDEIFSRFPEMNTSNFLGAGGDCSAFRYKHNKVIKLCAKDIVYFKKSATSEKLTVRTLKDLVDELQPYLFPIEKILYEDDGVFVYTQCLCRPLRELKKQMTPAILLEIFKGLHEMLCNGLFSEAIAMRSYGIYENKIALFDYHDIHHLNIQNKIIMGEEKWDRYIRNLTKHIVFLAGPEKQKQLKNKDYKQLDKIHSIPKVFINLLKYLENNKNTKNMNIDDLCDLFQDCIECLENM